MNSIFITIIIIQKSRVHVVFIHQYRGVIFENPIDVNVLLLPNREKICYLGGMMVERKKNTELGV